MSRSSQHTRLIPKYFAAHWPDVLFVAAGLLALFGSLFLASMFGPSPPITGLDGFIVAFSLLAPGIAGIVIAITTRRFRQRQIEQKLVAADREFFDRMAPAPAGGVLGYENVTGELPCPQCGRMTDSLKWMSFNTVVVFAIFMTWREGATCVCCSRCLRRKITPLLFMNMLTANVAWPFVAFGHLNVIRESFKRGHTPGVTQLFQASDEVATRP